MPQRRAIPFAEWRPDIALQDNEFASIAENVLPSANSYVPFPQLSALTNQPLASGNDSFTKILLPFDNTDASTTITDSNAGGSAHTWTAAGNAQIDTAQFKFGGSSLLCDGTGDWVTTADHADFTLGGGDWTVDFWFNCNAAGGTLEHICGQCDSTPTNASTSVRMNRTTGNFIQGIACVGGSAFTVTGTTQFTSTGWHHVAFVRTGDILRLFIDGVQEGGDVAITGTVNDSPEDFRVGAAGEVTTDPWTGWIDEFRLSVGVARWTAAFTPPVAPHLVSELARGMAIARTAGGLYKLYVGTPTKLLEWDGAGWQDVSRLSGGVYSLPLGDAWSFQQSGTNLVAVNVNVAPQVINVDGAAGTRFAALSGSPPQAVNAAQVGDFLVLSGISSNRRSIRWSAINDITGWTIGTNLSDEQVFPDGGFVQGVAGGEVGFVVQQASIRTMQFLPGDTAVIFSFSRIEDTKGCVSARGFVAVGQVLYFLAEDGFYSLGLGSGLQPIGAQKVNEWFIDHSDPERRDEVHCFAVPNQPRVAWAFHGSAGAAIHDQMLVYDWQLQRWVYAGATAQTWAPMALPNTLYTLDQVRDAIDENLDSGAPSLDAGAGLGGRQVLGAIDTNGLLSILDGAPMAATIETGWHHLSGGYRTFLSAVYPVIDASDVSVIVSQKETLSDTGDSNPAVMLEAGTGLADIRSSARLHKIRCAMPAGETWTHAQAAQVEAQPDGEA
jgi:hypothetical protein